MATLNKPAQVVNKVNDERIWLHRNKAADEINLAMVRLAVMLTLLSPVLVLQLVEFVLPLLLLQLLFVTLLLDLPLVLQQLLLVLECQ